MSEFNIVNKRNNLTGESIEPEKVVDNEKGISEESLEGLRAEYAPIGVMLEVDAPLPEPSSVRDFTFAYQPLNNKRIAFDIWQMIDGRWLHLNRVVDYRLHAVGTVYQDNTNAVITIANPDELTVVDGSNWSLFHQDNIKWIDGEGVFLIERSGEYLSAWSMSFTTSSANQDIECGWIIDGVRSKAGWAHRRIGTATDTGSFGGTLSGILRVGMKIGLGVINETSSANVIVNHATISISRIK